jgi:SAM-dependent methyltransferase
MNTENLVREHYSSDDLEERVLGALRDAGVDVDHLTVDDLGGLDQLHVGGRAATDHLLDALGVTADTTLLDVGAGIGGGARVAAARHGCRATGIDLTPGFVDVARMLTERVGLTGLVSFDVGSATELPYPDASFDRAMLNHVGMNIPAKDRMFGEVRRVLRPGGRFAVYDQMRVGDGKLTYPMPWAEDETSSFVETRDRYRELLTDAGFTLELDEDRTAAVAGPPPPGTLTPAPLLGGDAFLARLENTVAATKAGTLAPILIVASVR